MKVHYIHRCLSLSIYSLFYGFHRWLCNINFNNLFCVTCIVLIFLAEQFPYTSIPYLILEYMNAWYSSLANLFVTLYLILLKIPKYLISDLPKHSTCSLYRKVSSRVKPKYWNDLTLLIVISLVTIPSICFGIGLFVAWNSMKLVLSQILYYIGPLGVYLITLPVHLNNEDVTSSLIG